MKKKLKRPMDVTCPDDPDKILTLRNLAMPKDTNGNGDIFGGWVLAQMDIAGGSAVKRLTDHRIATVGIEAMKFIKPIYVGDEVSCYTKLLRTGTTSMTIEIDSWSYRLRTNEMIKVTTGVFTYVAIDENGRPTPII